MIILLRIVRNINAKRIRDDIPPMKGGSREVNQVYNSFAKLHKVVRFSNTAFFSGNLKWAYKFLNDALVLFRKLEDKKAIGIATNNLGNTLVAMYKENCSTRGCCRIDSRCVWNIGRQCYDEAIQLGSDDYLNNSGRSSTDCAGADFAEQLANRHFNRGLFYLLTRNDPCAAENSTERGYEDLLKARCLDREAHELRLQIGTKETQNQSDYFDKIIRRLRGLVETLEDDGVMDVLEIRGLIDEAEHVLFLAWNTSSPIFNNISRIGRLQQLEDIVVQHELCNQNVGEAARIGMRMLVEDDFVLEWPFSSAAKALLMVVRGRSPDNSLTRNDAAWTTRTVSATTADLRNMSRRCKTTSLDIGKNVFFCLDYSYATRSDETRRATENVVRIYDEYCADYDSVGLIPFNKTLDSNLKFPLTRKANAEKDQRSILSRATIASSETQMSIRDGAKMHSALSHAVQLVLDTGETDGNDTWILVLTDGDSFEYQKDQDVMSWISELNGKREAMINVIVVGVELADSEVDICKEYCMVSRESVYIDATGSADAIDKAFEDVARRLTVGASNGRFIYGGVTMEKF